ncbi:ribosomal RNA small subunit methyltransferase A, partial [Patescibacteria group bacterium]
MGQRFLKSRAALSQIINAAELTKDDIVLEIGPGKGILTEELTKIAKQVIAVEKDERLCAFLKKKYEKTSNLKVICADILSMPRCDLGILEHEYKIVANLPYYITSRFLRIFLSQTEFRPKSMVLMVQKEVAKRMCAKPPKMNLLALSVQAFAE